MKENLELERSDIRVDREIEIDPDNSFHLYVYLETWFDVLKKFDLTPWDDEDTSLDLYAVWNPITDYFICEYVIKSGNGDREYELYTPTENETKLMKEQNGIPVNDNTMVEVLDLCNYLGLDFGSYFGDYRPPVKEDVFKGNY